MNQALQYDSRKYEEEWRPIEGFPKYQVSSIGRIKSNVKRGSPIVMKAYK